MTFEEAIKRIDQHNKIHQKKEPFAVYITEALEMAIAALKKQIPQKPENLYYPHTTIKQGIICPNCNNSIIPKGSPYCVFCGQNLDWEN